jgi:pimeloyl-ACP methyl ester carboxylesterase
VTADELDRFVDADGFHALDTRVSVNDVQIVDDLGRFIEFADGVHLDGMVENITAPFLICHGENDRQIPLGYAHRSYQQAVKQPQTRTADLHT